VILYGPNGYGKSSLVEAIEWLLHGRAKRRERGQQLSKIDYKNYYRNAHAPDGADVAVEAEIAMDDSEHILRRELHDGPRNQETTKTFIDGEETHFSEIGLTEDPIFDPVIPQHSLQDFLLSRPKARRDKVSAAFGLDPLIQFSDALEKARNDFRERPPSEVNSAKKELANVLRLFEQGPDSPLVTEIQSKWENDTFDLSEDRARLERAVRDYLGSDAKDWNVLTNELQDERANRAARVFDVDTIRPPAKRKPKQESLRSTEREVSDETLPSVQSALQDYLEATAAEYTTELLQFWQAGLNQSDDSSDECPMCEEATLDDAKREELKQRIQNSSDFSSAEQQLEKNTTALVRKLRELLGSLENPFPTFLDSSARGELSSLVTDEEVYASFLSAHDEAKETKEEAEEKLDSLIDRLENVPKWAADPEMVGEVREVVETTEDSLHSTVEDVVQKCDAYAEAFKEFSEYLTNIISSTEAVKKVDGFLAVFQNWDAIKTLAEYHALLDESLRVHQNVKEHIQNKHDELFDTRGQDIGEWYKLMNPRSDVAFSRIDTGAESLRLYAESFGAELNAAASLSECQANCLGLSIHFMRALSSDSPFDFLVLDDPVQSMDDDHFETLTRDVVERLLDEQGVQLIVGSHMRGLTDKLHDLYYHRLPLYQRISKLEKSGPTITDNESVEDCIDRARHLADGNEDNRLLAVNVVRRAVEKLMRKVCRRNGQDDLPFDAPAKAMLPHFRKCDGVKPKHAATLQDTVNFSNPAHHDDPQWSVPKTQAIENHIDTLSGYRDQFSIA